MMILFKFNIRDTLIVILGPSSWWFLPFVFASLSPVPFNSNSNAFVEGAPASTTTTIISAEGIVTVSADDDEERSKIMSNDAPSEASTDGEFNIHDLAQHTVSREAAAPRNRDRLSHNSNEKPSTENAFAASTLSSGPDELHDEVHSGITPTSIQFPTCPQETGMLRQMRQQLRKNILARRDGDHFRSRIGARWQYAYSIANPADNAFANVEDFFGAIKERVKLLWIEKFHQLCLLGWEGENGSEPKVPGGDDANANGSASGQESRTTAEDRGVDCIVRQGYVQKILIEWVLAVFTGEIDDMYVGLLDDDVGGGGGPGGGSERSSDPPIFSLNETMKKFTLDLEEKILTWSMELTTEEKKRSVRSPQVFHETAAGTKKLKAKRDAHTSFIRSVLLDGKKAWLEKGWNGGKEEANDDETTDFRARSRTVFERQLSTRQLASFVDVYVRQLMMMLSLLSKQFRDLLFSENVLNAVQKVQKDFLVSTRKKTISVNSIFLPGNLQDLLQKRPNVHEFIERLLEDGVKILKPEDDLDKLSRGRQRSSDEMIREVFSRSEYHDEVTSSHNTTTTMSSSKTGSNDDVVNDIASEDSSQSNSDSSLFENHDVTTTITIEQRSVAATAKELYQTAMKARKFPGHFINDKEKTTVVLRKFLNFKNSDSPTGVTGVPLARRSYKNETVGETAEESIDINKVIKDGLFGIYNTADLYQPWIFIGGGGCFCAEVIGGLQLLIRRFLKVPPADHKVHGSSLTDRVLEKFYNRENDSQIESSDAAISDSSIADLKDSTMLLQNYHVVHDFKAKFFHFMQLGIRTGNPVVSKMLWHKVVGGGNSNDSSGNHWGSWGSGFSLRNRPGDAVISGYLHNFRHQDGHIDLSNSEVYSGNKQRQRQQQQQSTAAAPKKIIFSNIEWDWLGKSDIVPPIMIPFFEQLDRKIDELLEFRQYPQGRHHAITQMPSWKKINTFITSTVQGFFGFFGYFYYLPWTTAIDRRTEKARVSVLRMKIQMNDSHSEISEDSNNSSNNYNNNNNPYNNNKPQQQICPFTKKNIVRLPNLFYSKSGPSESISIGLDSVMEQHLYWITTVKFLTIRLICPKLFHLSYALKAEPWRRRLQKSTSSFHVGELPLDARIAIQECVKAIFKPYNDGGDGDNDHGGGIDRKEKKPRTKLRLFSLLTSSNVPLRVRNKNHRDGPKDQKSRFSLASVISDVFASSMSKDRAIIGNRNQQQENSYHTTSNAGNNTQTLRQLLESQIQSCKQEILDSLQKSFVEHPGPKGVRPVRPGIEDVESQFLKYLITIMETLELKDLIGEFFYLLNELEYYYYYVSFCPDNGYLTRSKRYVDEDQVNTLYKITLYDEIGNALSNTGSREIDSDDRQKVKSGDTRSPDFLICIQDAIRGDDAPGISLNRVVSHHWTVLGMWPEAAEMLDTLEMRWLPRLDREWKSESKKNENKLLPRSLYYSKTTLLSSSSSSSGIGYNTDSPRRKVFTAQSILPPERCGDDYENYSGFDIIEDLGTSSVDSNRNLTESNDNTVLQTPTMHKLTRRVKTTNVQQCESFKNTYRKNFSIVDVGANIGSNVVLFGKLGYNVLAVEPLPTNFRFLNATVCVNNLDEEVLAVNAAIGQMAESNGSENGSNEKSSLQKLYFFEHAEDAAIGELLSEEQAKTMVSKTLLLNGYNDGLEENNDESETRDEATASVTAATTNFKSIWDASKKHEVPVMSVDYMVEEIWKKKKFAGKQRGVKQEGLDIPDIPRLALFKTDTEGWDIEVLQSAKNTLGDSNEKKNSVDSKSMYNKPLLIAEINHFRIWTRHSQSRVPKGSFKVGEMSNTVGNLIFDQLKYQGFSEWLGDLEMVGENGWENLPVGDLVDDLVDHWMMMEDDVKQQSLDDDVTMSSGATVVQQPALRNSMPSSSSKLLFHKFLSVSQFTLYENAMWNMVGDDSGSDYSGGIESNGAKSSSEILAIYNANDIIFTDNDMSFVIEKVVRKLFAAQSAAKSSGTTIDDVSRDHVVNDNDNVAITRQLLEEDGSDGSSLLLQENTSSMMPLSNMSNIKVLIQKLIDNGQLGMILTNLVQEALEKLVVLISGKAPSDSTTVFSVETNDDKVPLLKRLSTSIQVVCGILKNHDFMNHSVKNSGKQFDQTLPKHCQIEPSDNSTTDNSTTPSRKNAFKNFVNQVTKALLSSQSIITSEFETTNNVTYDNLEAGPVPAAKNHDDRDTERKTSLLREMFDGYFETLNSRQPAAVTTPTTTTRGHNDQKNSVLQKIFHWRCASLCTIQLTQGCKCFQVLHENFFNAVEKIQNNGSSSSGNKNNALKSDKKFELLSENIEKLKLNTLTDSQLQGQCILFKECDDAIFLHNGRRFRSDDDYFFSGGTNNINMAAESSEKKQKQNYGDNKLAAFFGVPHSQPRVEIFDNFNKQEEDPLESVSEKIDQIHESKTAAPVKKVDKPMIYATAGSYGVNVVVWPL